MDDLTYHYITGKNQLEFVDDGFGSTPGIGDIDDQSSGNYTYDATGNLISDAQEQISQIKWTVAGKVDSIAALGSCERPSLKFYYDAFGNRIGKLTYITYCGAWGYTIPDIHEMWYVRDAQGNIMATYIEHGDSLIWTEQHIYGSSRVGIWQPNKIMYPDPAIITTDTFHFTVNAGDKRYELTNHLGNVMAVVTDRKIGIDITADTLADYYTADIASVQDYYPGGMVLPGRSYTVSNGYRFGYQGSLKDDEIKGSGNSYTTEFRELDPRINLWWSPDPDHKKTAWESPYVSMNDNPILKNDPLGNYSKFGASWRSVVHSGHDISYTKSTGEWGYNKSTDGGVEYKDGLSKAERQSRIAEFKSTSTAATGVAKTSGPSTDNHPNPNTTITHRQTTTSVEAMGVKSSTWGYSSLGNGPVEWTSTDGDPYYDVTVRTNYPGPINFEQTTSNESNVGADVDLGVAGTVSVFISKNYSTVEWTSDPALTTDKTAAGHGFTLQVSNSDIIAILLLREITKDILITEPIPAAK